MDTLNNARDTINQIDRQLAELFVKRMQAVKEVACYKEERGLPIFDPTREKEVLEKAASYVEDDALRSYYLLLQKELMRVSKAYQHTLIKGVRIAYSGVAGAFAAIASEKLFPEATLVPCRDFESAYRAVETGECELAVLPIENSHAGEVGEVLDLTYRGSLTITGVYDLSIRHHLLALEGATPADIKTVISHPQALDQCAAYIKEKGYAAERAVNTAVAAQTVVEKGDKSIAAIASRSTASLYGLTVLDHDVNESATNTTRFAVYSRVENQAGNKKDRVFVLLFTVSNIAGALAKAVNVISAYGFNMRVLRSRPVKDKPFAYYFYAEAEGDERSENGKAMLRALSACCENLKLAGSYTPSAILEN